MTSTYQDAQGYIYYTGYTYNSLAEPLGGVYDTYVAKYSSTGVFQWVRQLGQTTLGGAAAGNEQPNAVTTDAAGNVYVAGITDFGTGEAYGGGAFDIFYASWTSNGTFRWIKQLGNVTMPGTSAASDGAFALISPNANELWIGGDTQGNLCEPTAGATDMVLLSVSTTTGAINWCKQWGMVTAGAAVAGNTEFITGFAMTPAGNVVGAFTTNSSFADVSSGNYDIAVAEFTSTGNINWKQQVGSTKFPGSSSNHEYTTSVSVGLNGNIAITGYTNGNLVELNGGTQDVFVASFSSTGAILWVDQLGVTSFGAAANGFDKGFGVVVDPLGNVFVSGQTTGSFFETNGGGGQSDAFLAKWDSTGHRLWQKQFGAISLPASTMADFVAGLHMDSSQNLYLTGQTYSSLGTTLVGGCDPYFIKFTP